MRQRLLDQLPLAGLLLIALFYRLFLDAHYLGWEESDFGNLAMAKGVLDSSFTHYDMRHLPFYYFLSALVLSVVGDAIIATHTVSMVCGVISVGVGYAIADRCAGRTVAIMTGVLLCFQPEFALYSSTSLREPVFICFAQLGCLALIAGRPGTSAFMTGLSFLTRFDSLGTHIPATLLTLARRPRAFARLRGPLYSSLLIFVLFIGAWSIYCGQVHGTYLFFAPTIEVNIDTGGAQETVGAIQFVSDGMVIDAALFFQTLPHHLGLLVYTFALLGMLARGRQLFTRGPVSIVFTYLVFNTAFWLGVGFVAQHEPEHNLYWKWMTMLVPSWAFFAADFAGRLPFKKLTAVWRIALALVLVLFVAIPFARETQAQVSASRQLYGPQVELAEWVDAHVPRDSTLLFDNIPACYLNRKDHSLNFLSWFDISVPDNDPEAMAQFLEREGVSYVLWFREDWTQAPRIAPYLAEVDVHEVGDLTLKPLFHDEAYGFIFYEVIRSTKKDSTSVPAPSDEGVQ